MSALGRHTLDDQLDNELTDQDRNISMKYYHYIGLFHVIKSRSSHRKCSVKKGVLKNFSNFTGKHLCWSLI